MCSRRRRAGLNPFELFVLLFQLGLSPDLDDELILLTKGHLPDRLLHVPNPIVSIVIALLDYTLLFFEEDFLALSFTRPSC